MADVVPTDAEAAVTAEPQMPDDAPGLPDPLDPFALPPIPRPHRSRAVRHAQRTAWLHLRLLPSERIRLVAGARRSGYPDISSWARGTLLAACDGATLPILDGEAVKAVERLRRDLNSGSGANLNQALLHANRLAREGAAPDERTLMDAVDGARAALDALRADLGLLLGPGGRA